MTGYAAPRWSRCCTSERAFAALDARGLSYTHKVEVLSAHPDHAHVVFPHVHRVAALLKRWLLGTHQGSVEAHHLDSYLDEFVFRFNRRNSRNRGLLFWRLLCAMCDHPPLTRAELSARKAAQAAADQCHEASALLRTRTENEARNRDRYRQRAAAEGRSVRPYRRKRHTGEDDPF